MRNARAGRLTFETEAEEGVFLLGFLSVFFPVLFFVVISARIIAQSVCEVNKVRDFSEKNHGLVKNIFLLSHFN